MAKASVYLGALLISLVAGCAQRSAVMPSRATKAPLGNGDAAAAVSTLPAGSLSNQRSETEDFGLQPSALDLPPFAIDIEGDVIRGQSSKPGGANRVKASLTSLESGPNASYPSPSADASKPDAVALGGRALVRSRDAEETRVGNRIGPTSMSERAAQDADSHLAQAPFKSETAADDPSRRGDELNAEGDARKNEMAEPKVGTAALAEDLARQLETSQSMPSADGRRRAGSADETSRFLRGDIFGLNSAGLVISDALGNVLRPKGGATVFQFRGEAAARHAGEGHRLIIVRQPIGQTCHIEGRLASHGTDDIRCHDASDTKPPEAKPTMRECFQVTARGAAFSLGYRRYNRWQRYADVATDPVGIDRQQHKTYIGGRIVLEAIIHFPLVAPIANIEWLSFKGGASNALVLSGKTGGMPLDLKAGESRSFDVIALAQEANQAHARLTTSEHRVKLMAIGPLNTRGGHFPLTCHLEEGFVGSKTTRNSWYAPGYGTVKTDFEMPDGSVRTVEVIEIQQAPI